MKTNSTKQNEIHVLIEKHELTSLVNGKYTTTTYVEATKKHIILYVNAMNYRHTTGMKRADFAQNSPIST